MTGLARLRKLAAVFYGWKIVSVTFVTHFISVGFIFYSYGAFFKPLAADFGVTRLEISLGLSLMQGVTALFAPLLGRMLDRGSIRATMLAGVLLMSTGFFVISRISEIWQFYAVLGSLLALGAAMVGGLAGATLVANWFVERRGTALGVATIGISISGLVMAPAATQLIGWIGWRTTFVLYGCIALCVVAPLVWGVIVNRPEDLGLEPDGSGRRLPETGAAQPTLPLAPGDQIIDHPASFDWSARGALRERNFWVITLVVGLNFCAMGSVLTHIIPHTTDMGIPAERAAWVLSAMAGLGVGGKVIFGWLADRGQLRRTLWLAIGFQALGLGLIMRASSYGAMVVAGGVFGLGMGGLVPLWGVLIGAVFGRFAFGRIMGLMSPCMLPIQMPGVPLAGYIFDRSGSYDLAFGLFLVLYLLSMGLLLLLRLPSGSGAGGHATIDAEDGAGDVGAGA